MELFKSHRGGGGKNTHIGGADTQGQGCAVLQGVDEGVVQTFTAPADGDDLAAAGEMAVAFAGQSIEGAGIGAGIHKNAD